MADKNQLSLANGVPPQFSTGNSTPQTTCGPQSQAQRGLAPGVNNCLNSDQFQKLQTSMVNGQISPNTRINNWDQQSGQSNMNVNYNSSSAGNISFNQQSLGATQTQHQMPFHTTKSSLTYSGNINPILPLNVHSNINQPSMSMGTQSNTITPPASFNQMSPNIPSSKQNILKPLPVIGSSSNVLTTGVLQPMQSGSGDAPQNQVFQNINKAKSLVSQYSSTHKITGPPTMQMNKPLYGPSTTVVPSKLSPHNKPIVAISPYSDYVSPPTSQNVNLSQHKTPIPGSQSNQIFSNVSPSFQQSSAQNLTGIPQGYQPQNFMPNQMPSKTSLSNPSYTSENQPTYNYSKSEHGAQNYQSQGLGNRNFGPPQMGSLSASNSVPHQQSPFTSETPPANNPYGNVKTSGMNALMGGIERMSVTHQGFNKLWGMETIDLLQCRNILPPQKVTPPPIRLHQEFMDNVNCSPDIFRCTLNRIPETNSLLQKSRLPLGILIHPFRDLDQLPVIQCSSIVRCRACRTYINPFVYFVDNKRWKCNLCFRVNELPDEFQYDPVSKTYGDPSRRPEIRSSTIEFIAPSEYMLRPPQPAIYLFVLDVSRWGCDSGYLHTLCSVLLEELDNIPGDSRTQIGFILFDSTIHFFSIAENYNQAHEMIVTDIDDVFLPTPDSLLVNLNENRQLIKDLLKEIPKKYAESYDTDSCLGPALQAAFKLMSPTGGRITVFQSCLPNKGPGVLSPREDPNQRSSKDVRHLGPQTDFYKRLSLDCSTQQISVDLFLVSSQYSDLSTLGGISQFSGGCIYYFPLFRRINPESNERLSRALRRYLTRKIGFEAVMRVRCSRGLSIHTFHGNFFVRSTDLLSLPNVNPDAGFGMQIAIEDSLCELQCVCFQAAVLYTSAKGERRIRVHTLCLPVSSNLSDILTSADQQAIVGLLAKMAVDRSLKSSLSDAREAFINVAIDILSAYKLVETSGGQNTILAPVNLSLIPLYILALLKSTAFRTGQNTRLDDRVNAMSQMKTLPLRDLIQLIHPDLYHVTHLDEKSGVEFEDKLVAQPPRLSLSSEHLDSRGAFLLDTPEVIYLLVGRNVNTEFLVNIFDVRDIRQINKDMVDLPELENDESDKLRHFINFLQSDKPWPSVIKVVTEPIILTPFLINDKAENALSYHELLHHVKAQLK